MNWIDVSEGLRLEYRTLSASGESEVSLEILEVRREGAATIARVRRAWRGAGGTGSSEERLELREDGCFRDGGLELPSSPAPGARWARPPREYFVEGLDGAVETPAGRFSGCLRVGYLIAAGDAGSGERLYAPGVGLVYEKCSAEAEPYSTKIVAVRRKS